MLQAGLRPGIKQPSMSASTVPGTIGTTQSYSSDLSIFLFPYS